MSVPDRTATTEQPSVDYDRWRKTIGLFLGPALALVLLLIPMDGLSRPEQNLAAIAILMVTYWITEAVPYPVTSMLGIALIVIFGVQPAGDVLPALGDQVIYLFIGSFMMARAMQVHGLDKRIAYTLLSFPWVGDSTIRTMLMLGLTSWLLSMWISNTATAAMLIPVAVTVAHSMATVMHGAETAEAAASRRKFVTGLLLLVAYAASIGGLATPIGTPSNLLGIALIEQQYSTNIQFLEWMAFALPLAIILLGIAFGIIMLFFRPAVRTVPGQLAAMQASRRDLGTLSAGERNCLIVVGVVISLWFVPDILNIALGSDNSFATSVNKRLPEGVSSILAASLLFVLPVSWKEREYTLSWPQAVRIDWGTVLLFAGGIALGSALFATGLAKAVGDEIVALVGTDPAVLKGVAVVTGALVSEATSNTASVNIVAPVMAAVAGSGALGIVVTVTATLAVGLGFMLPVSTPPNAIVYGTGDIKLTDMIKSGIFLSILGGFVVWLFALWVLPELVRA